MNSDYYLSMCRDFQATKSKSFGHKFKTQNLSHDIMEPSFKINLFLKSHKFTFIYVCNSMNGIIPKFFNICFGQMSQVENIYIIS